MNRMYRSNDYDHGQRARYNWFGIRPFWYAIALSLLIWAIAVDALIP